MTRLDQEATLLRTYSANPCSSSKHKPCRTSAISVSLCLWRARGYWLCPRRKSVEALLLDARQPVLLPVDHTGISLQYLQLCAMHNNDCHVTMLDTTCTKRRSQITSFAGLQTTQRMVMQAADEASRTGFRHRTASP